MTWLWQALDTTLFLASYCFRVLPGIFSINADPVLTRALHAQQADPCFRRKG
jgi:hypothetical protein